MLTVNRLCVGIAGGGVLLTATLPCLLRAFVTVSLKVLVGMVVLAVAVSGARYGAEAGPGPRMPCPWRTAEGPGRTA